MKDDNVFRIETLWPAPVVYAARSATTVEDAFVEARDMELDAADAVCDGAVIVITGYPSGREVAYTALRDALVAALPPARPKIGQLARRTAL